MHSCVEHEKLFITLGPGHFIIFLAFLYVVNTEAYITILDHVKVITILDHVKVITNRSRKLTKRQIICQSTNCLSFHKSCYL